MATRYDQLGPLDDQSKPLGDRMFIGVNMRLEPSLVPQGYASEAVNMRFRNGIAETRKGFVFPTWANHTTTSLLTISSLTRVGTTATAVTSSAHGLATDSVAVISGAANANYNGTFLITVLSATSFTYPVTASGSSPDLGAPKLNLWATAPWVTVHGVGVFSDPFTHQEYLIIAADGGIYYTQPGNIPQAMTLPAGVTLTGTMTVEFTQAFDVLLMHRGPDAPALVLTRITSAWTLVDQTAHGDGTTAIPNSTHSLYLANRLFVPTSNDDIAVSDLNDYTRYVPVLQEFKVNQGSADSLTAIFKFNDTTIIALKSHSIYALSGVYGNLSALQQDELTNQFGCVARKSVAQVGKDLWFLSELGVMSIAQTEQNKLQGVVLPVSDPIQPLIERINWKYASGAVGQVWDSKYYLAVPLDDAEAFGPELLYGGEGPCSIPVTVGRTYYYDKGEVNDNVPVTDGVTTLTTSGRITAQSATLTFPNGVALGSLREVFTGVNNAILVFDFLNGAWAGYDEADGFSWRDLFRFTVADVRRLMSVTSAGWIALMEEDYEDQIPTPYIDITVSSVPVNGNTIRVNGGATITVDTGPGQNTATTWGAIVPADVSYWQSALSTDVTQIGFSNIYGLGWTAPNVFVVQDSIIDGNTLEPQPITHFYSTNGMLPIIEVTGTWATITYHNCQPVVSRLLSRGYTSDVLALAAYDWLTVDLQTWAPSTTIEAISSGVNEVETVVEDRTRNRARYYQPGDAAAYDLDNDNGDFLVPYREDYSLRIGPATTAGATPDFAIYTTEDGVGLGLHQEARITERINATGRSLQVRITNTEGRVRVMALALEINENQTTAGTAA